MVARVLNSAMRRAYTYLGNNNLFNTFMKYSKKDVSQRVSRKKKSWLRNIRGWISKNPGELFHFVWDREAFKFEKRHFKKKE